MKRNKVYFLDTASLHFSSLKLFSLSPFFYAALFPSVHRILFLPVPFSAKSRQIVTPSVPIPSARTLFPFLKSLSRLPSGNPVPTN